MARKKTSTKSINKSKAKKSKKRDEELAGLNPRKFSKIKQEFHDIDYIDKLSEEEKLWLHKFMEEDLGARFNHSGKKIYRKKVDELESYKRNNRRNFDVYSRNRAAGTVQLNTDVTDLLDKIQNLETTNPEDAIIEQIDLKKATKNSKLIQGEDEGTNS